MDICLQKRDAILDALCIEYTTVLLCDLKKDTYEVFKNSPSSHMTGALRAIPKDEQGVYSTLFQYFDREIFISESADGFWKMLNPKTLMESLSHQDTYALRFHTIKNPAGMEYFALKAVRLHIDEEHFHVIIGMQPVDELVKKDKENQIRLENALVQANLNNEIISAIAKLYWMIYRIDLETGIYEEISSGEEIHRLTGKQGQAVEAFQRLLNDIVSDEHKEKMTEFVDVTTLAERMQDKETIAREFCSADGHWYQSRFIEKKRDDKGRLIKVLHLVRDIDSQKHEELERGRQVEIHAQNLQKALTELQQNTEIIQAIANEYTTVFWESLEDGSYKTIAARKALEDIDITGSARLNDDICKKTMEISVAPEMREVMWQFIDPMTLADRLRDKTSIAFDYKSPDDKWFTAEFIVKKRNEAGRVTEVLYVDKEITSDKKRELEYQEKLKLIALDAEKANASKSDFLRRMSHDIRTPINGIRGMLEMAETFSNDPEKLKECREKARISTDHLLSLVNDILDMNKLESGRIVLKQDSFSLIKLLKEVCTVSGAQAMDLGVNFSLGDVEIKHPHLIGSPTHLKQILLNFGSNAVKFNHVNGSVVVGCRELECDEHRAVFAFTCEDTGIGMSEEFQQHMFEPFMQEGQSGARTTYAGSGLGMPIAKQLAELMGGSVQVESKLGVGTKITCIIPFEIDPEAVVEEEEKKETLDLTGRKALLAEDNELNAEIARFLLEKQGLSVTWAANGREAGDTFAKAPKDYDVIFMDIMMPEMDGLEAAKAIRDLPCPEGKAVPIFAMTANAFIDDIERRKAAGMNEHLTKPLQEDEIIKALNKHLSL